MTDVSIQPATNIPTASRMIRANGAYVIAEMACAHDGDFNKARELIDVACVASADAVQLQIFHAPANMVKRHKIYPLLQKIEFSPDQWAELVAYGRSRGIDVFACAYDMPSLELAIRLGVDGIKFNSADLNNFEMLQRVASSAIPFTLGTGASRMDEIGEAVRTVLAAGGNHFVLMHGMQSFPTAVEQANVSRIRVLSQMFNALVGYADHTDGDNPFAIDIDLLAMGVGACVFEKHYTLDRSLKGTDHQAALNPDELAAYVMKIRQGALALGSPAVRAFSADEIKYRTFQKKRLVAATDLAVGHQLRRQDILLLRTEESGGFDAAALDSVVGRSLSNPLAAEQLIHPADLA